MPGCFHQLWDWGGIAGSNSRMKQVVMGKLDPVLSGARVGIGILLCTYNLLTCLVSVVWCSSKKLPVQEQLKRDKTHVCNGNRRRIDATDIEIIIVNISIALNVCRALF